MKIFGALGIDVKIFLAHFLNFAILFYILYKFGYKYIFNFLENRKQQIEKGLSDAKKAEDNLIQIQKKEEEVLAKAKIEAQKIILIAENIARKNKEEILEQAQQEAKRIMDIAQKKVKEERHQIMSEAKSEISSLVISVAEKILGKKIDSDTDKQLIEKAIQ